MSIKVLQNPICGSNSEIALKNKRTPSTHADIPAKAIPITGEAARRSVLSKVVAKWGKQNEIEAFVRDSPLVEVQLEAD